MKRQSTEERAERGSEKGKKILHHWKVLHEDKESPITADDIRSPASNNSLQAYGQQFPKLHPDQTQVEDCIDSENQKLNTIILAHDFEGSVGFNNPPSDGTTAHSITEDILKKALDLFSFAQKRPKENKSSMSISSETSVDTFAEEEIAFKALREKARMQELIVQLLIIDHNIKERHIADLTIAKSY